MKIQSVTAENFASYAELEFTFTGQGLTLIQGPTGAGKSTLCDLIPWVLFGKTAKGGTVSEVLSWPGDKVTTATVVLSEHHSITRTRGSKPGDNDLYYTDGEHVYRGKDLIDTQRLINVWINMDYELYLASSYFHEFSQTAQFFTTTAKSRRAICEQLVDLTLAKNLAAKTSDAIKAEATILQKANAQLAAIDSRISLLERLQQSENNKAATWEETHKANKEVLIKSHAAYEANRKKIVSKTCPSCKTVLIKPKEIVDDSANPYTQRLNDLEMQQNPYTGGVKDYTAEIAAQGDELIAADAQAAASTNRIEELSLLQQVIQDYRSVTIENTIKDVEGKTNQLLSKHFDAEIQVQFEIEQADKLEVTIFKDSNTASYTQLSKGQRCLLKLCFGVAVMEAVSNHHGIQPQQLFFDEALDGLSEEFKVKAFSLLETLSLTYNSIFVVEHSSELKTLFPNSYSVRLNEGSSEIHAT